MNDDLNTKVLASEVCKKLIILGFIVQQVDSKTTNSVYLILDHGAIEMIRISDHIGARHKFNLLTNIDKCKKPRQGRNAQCFYSANHVKRMVNEVYARKCAFIIKYGFERYLKRADSNSEKEMIRNYG